MSIPSGYGKFIMKVVLHKDSFAVVLQTTVAVNVGPKKFKPQQFNTAELNRQFFDTMESGQVLPKC